MSISSILRILYQKRYNLFMCVLGLPKTIYFNMKYLPLVQALRFPILISHRVYLLDCAGTIKLKGPIKLGLIRVGFGRTGIFDHKYSRCIWQVEGNVIFNGMARFGCGSKISVGKEGNLVFGEGFSITAESAIVCQKLITFGKNVLISWDNLFMDTDFHHVYINDKVINEPKAIHIGDHVWFGCRCTILKGCYVPNDTIIAANSLLNGSYDITNAILGGSPAKILKQGVKWDA